METITGRELWLQNNAIKLVNTAKKLHHYDQIDDYGREQIVDLADALDINLFEFYDVDNSDVYEYSNGEFLEAIEDGELDPRTLVEVGGLEALNGPVVVMGEFWPSIEAYAEYCFNCEFGNWKGIAIDWERVAEEINDKLSGLSGKVSDFYKVKEKILESAEPTGEIHEIGDHVYQVVMYEGFCFHRLADHLKNLSEMVDFEPEPPLERLKKKPKEDQEKIYALASEIAGFYLTEERIEFFQEGLEKLCRWISEQKVHAEYQREALWEN